MVALETWFQDRFTCLVSPTEDECVDRCYSRDPSIGQVTQESCRLHEL
jgi:hypothetical protein